MSEKNDPRDEEPDVGRAPTRFDFREGRHHGVTASKPVALSSNTRKVFRSGAASESKPVRQASNTDHRKKSSSVRRSRSQVPKTSFWIALMHRPWRVVAVGVVLFVSIYIYTRYQDSMNEELRAAALAEERRLEKIALLEKEAALLATSDEVDLPEDGLSASFDLSESVEQEVPFESAQAPFLND